MRGQGWRRWQARADGVVCARGVRQGADTAPPKGAVALRCAARCVTALRCARRGGVSRGEARGSVPQQPLLLPSRVACAPAGTAVRRAHRLAHPLLPTSSSPLPPSPEAAAARAPSRRVRARARRRTRALPFADPSISSPSDRPPPRDAPGPRPLPHPRADPASAPAAPPRATASLSQAVRPAVSPSQATHPTDSASASANASHRSIHQTRAGRRRDFGRRRRSVRPRLIGNSQGRRAGGAPNSRGARHRSADIGG